MRTVVVFLRIPRLPYNGYYRVEYMNANELREFIASLDIMNLRIYRSPDLNSDLVKKFSTDIHVPPNVIEGLPLFDPDYPPPLGRGVRWIGIAWWLGSYQLSILETESKTTEREEREPKKTPPPGKQPR